MEVESKQVSTFVDEEREIVVKSHLGKQQELSKVKGFKMSGKIDQYN